MDLVAATNVTAAIAVGARQDGQRGRARGLRRRGVARARGRQTERCRVEVGTTDGVVEELHAPDHLTQGAVAVVDVGDVHRRADCPGRVAVDVVDADDPDDVAVVAHDHVGVAVVREVSLGSHARRLVAASLRTGPAEDQVGAVRPLVRCREAEEVGVATHQVVLAEATEDRVVAAVALDVVLTVGGCLEGRDDAQRADVVADLRAALAADRGAGGADVVGHGRVIGQPSEGRRDATVTLDDVVAELAEDVVVVRTACEVVVAEAAGPGVAQEVGEVLVELGDVVLRPPRCPVGIAEGPLRAVDQQQTAVVSRDQRATTARVGPVGAAVEKGSAQGLETGAQEVSKDQGGVVPEDQVVLLVAVCEVVAGTGQDHVTTEVAEDDVVGTVLQRAGLDRQHRAQRRRLDLLQLGGRQVRVQDVLDHRTVVAEDDVVVRRLRAAQDGAEALAVDQVAAGQQLVTDR